MNENTYENTELVIALVGAVGVELDAVSRIIRERLKIFNYISKNIKISKDIINDIDPYIEDEDEFKRINNLMTKGNELRKKSRDNSFLAKCAAAKISQIREKKDVPNERTAFIISSLKTPEEVKELRKIYSNGFFLIGIHATDKRRFIYLNNTKNISKKNIKKLKKRDKDELNDYGQKTRDTYHLSDFFVNFDGTQDKLENNIWRIIDLIFGNPFVTPTFDEYAMFMAFSAALRSADLARQVGAVITNKNEIISTGANDVPRAGGGLYWPEFCKHDKSIKDHPKGRDFVIGYDSNKKEQQSMIKNISDTIKVESGLNLSEENIDCIKKSIRKSCIKNITEYGRSVHAEMEAILSCARNNISTQGASLYCTTFPCHNCAKHIVASGIIRVVYVEPYPKSKAIDFHGDSIQLSHEFSKETDIVGKVIFESFTGVGPRSFFKLFSIALGSGDALERKNSQGKTVKFKRESATLRMKMLPTSYIERERHAASIVEEKLEEIIGECDEK